MKKILINISLLTLSINIMAQLPKVLSGSIKRYENFASKYVTARNVDVWLPEGYSKKKKYTVLYMSEGQALYDAATTWNHQAWDVDDAITKLQLNGKIKNGIVIGFWNGGKTRHPDYFPQNPYESLTQIQKDPISALLQRAGGSTESFNPVSDNCLSFLVTELKPFIDKNVFN